jgi:hypothetical protein
MGLTSVPMFGASMFVADKAPLRQSPFWNPDFVNHMASEHIAGRKNYVREINAVLTLQADERLFIQN